MSMDFHNELIKIISKSPVIVFLWRNSEGWPVEFVSENISELGYNSQDFLNGKLMYADIVHPDDLERLNREIILYSKSDVTEFSQEYRLISKNNKILWVDNRTLIRKDINGKITHFQGIILDITERKELEHKIIESETLFRTVLDFTNIGFAIQQDNTIIYVNKALSSIIEYSIEEALNWEMKDYLNLIPPEYQQIIIERLKVHQKEEEGVYTFTEFPIFTKNGRIKWLYTNETSIIYNNKPAIITAVIDITEKRKTEEKLIESEQNYRKAYERENFYKDLFTHDMRNILHGIMSILETFYFKNTTQRKTGSFEDLIKKMQTQISRGSRLVKNVRKISEIEETNRSLFQVNILHHIKEACQNIKNSIDYKEIIISIDPLTEEFYILADDLIQFVIDNILLNAIIHNNNKIVKVDIKLSQYQENLKDFIKIEFIDNGKGIPDYKKKLIFNREFSKDNSTIGMGLGLSLVRMVLEKYSATIFVKNRVEKDYSQGSRFIINFPRCKI